LLLHPERNGQTGGRIDPAIAILDGVGLLVFVIPGLVAFGVDFATGAIYLPSDHASAPAPTTELEVVHTRPDTLSIGEIEAIVSSRIGERVRIDGHTHVYEVRDRDAFGLEYSKLDAAGVISN
jgi:hypothetical protein